MAGRKNVRDDLIAAAEQLFATSGFDGVSLREITAASGATNASAVQYHFGDRDGLVRAVVARHQESVDERRHELLDAIAAPGAGADGAGALPALVRALVVPYAGELEEPGGAGFLRLVSDLLNHPRWSADWQPRVEGSTSYLRWRDLMTPHLGPEALRRHRRFVALRFTVTELARRGAMPERTDHGRFVAELVDLVSGLLTAPVTPWRRGPSARGSA